MDKGSRRSCNYKLQVHYIIWEEDRDRFILDFKVVCLLKLKSNVQRIEKRCIIPKKSTYKRKDHSTLE